MTVEFYEKENGVQPAKEFLLSLSEIDKAISNRQDYERRQINE